MITKIVIWLFQVNIHLNVTINKNMKIDFSKLERKTGFEPATLSLEG